MTYRGRHSNFLITLMDKCNIEYYANYDNEECYVFLWVKGGPSSLRIATTTPHKVSDISFKEVVKYILEYGK